VCGGPAFSILPAECLDFVGADLGIAGDAAESFAALLDCLDDGAEHRDLPGLVYRDGARIVVQEGRVYSDFRRLPRLDLLDLPRYDGAGFGVGVVTKLARRYYPGRDSKDQSSGDGLRIRPVEEVVSEVRRLRRDLGLGKVFFIDSGFNVPQAHAKALCQGLADAGLGIRWNSYLRVGDCNRELVGLMRDSGCSLALINAPEPEQDEGDGLGSRLEGVRRLAACCRQASLPFTLSLGFGGPGEVESTVEQKLAFLAATDPAFATLRVGTRVLPGTRMASIALEEGLISSETDLINPTFYVASGAREWLADRLRAEASTHPQWNLV
jgi:hypothetical protein